MERIEKNPRFLPAFKDLGSTWELSEETFKLLEEYVCVLYGCRKKNVNQARYYLFQRKYRRDEKIIDLSILPPCKSVLLLHANRANYVAKIWKRSEEPQLQTPDIDIYGWKMNYEIKWFEKEFPDDIEDLLIDPAFDELETDDFGRDEESDDDEED